MKKENKINTIILGILGIICGAVFIISSILTLKYQSIEYNISIGASVLLIGLSITSLFKLKYVKE